MNAIGRINGPSPRPHAVVIGAGIGGLASAARLAARGYRVTVLEKLDAPGGRAYVHRRDGHVFDAGPTIITAPQVLEELWRDCGSELSRDVTLQRCDPFYRIRFDDGSTLDYGHDQAAMEAQIRRFHPDDVEGYRAFMKVSERIYKKAYEELAERPFHSIGFTASTLFDLLRLGGHRSVHSTASRHFRDPRLRVAFSFHPLLIGGNPFTTTALYCLISHLESKFGVHHVVGGTGRLVAAMVELIRRNGGEVRLNCEVARIETQGRHATGVVLADGRHIACDILISNAEPAWTYGKLLKDLPRRRWTDARLARADYSMGLFVWYFGTDRRYDDVLQHNILLGPRYRGLLDDVFKRKRLADDFSLYLHRPSANDPNMAPAGRDSFYVLSPVPNLKSGTDWNATAEAYRKRIERFLESTLLPGLSGALTASMVATPEDFRHRLNAWQGAAFAMEPNLFQSAWFRPHNKSEELDNLYMTGAGTHPGAGVPGVLASAKIVAGLVPDPTLASTLLPMRGTSA